MAELSRMIFILKNLKTAALMGWFIHYSSGVLFQFQAFLDPHTTK